MKRTHVWIGIGVAALLAGAVLRLVVEPSLESAAPPPQRDVAAPTAAPVVDAASSRIQRSASDDLPPPVDLTACDRDLDLFGVVVDESDIPVAGASVESFRFPEQRTDLLADAARSNAADAGPRTITAGDGTFVLHLARGDVVAVRASAGTAVGGRRDCQAGERVRIVLRPAASLEVFAKDERGAPVEGARVWLWPRDGALLGAEPPSTDANGRAFFAALNPRTLTVTMEHPVRANPPWKKVTLAAGRPSSLEFVLVEGRTISGSVTDAATGRPIANARVGEGWSAERPVSTDATGKYARPGSDEAWEWRISARAPGYSTAVEVARDRETIDFALHRAHRVVGRLLDARGRPVAAVPVAAVNSERSERRDGISDADGRFAVEDLGCEAPCTLVVQARGHGRYLLDVEPGGAAETIDAGDIVLPEPRSIAGRVLDSDGRPLAGARVELQGWNSDRMRLRREGSNPAADPDQGGREVRTSDDLGRFRFVELSPGDYALLARHHGQLVERSATLGADRDVDGVVLQMPSGGTLKVRVVWGDPPAPLADAFISIAGSVQSWLQTDEDGLAIFDGLPDEPFRIRVRAWDGAKAAGEVVANPGSEEVRIDAIERVEIAGRVVDASGSPLPGMHVAVRTVDIDEGTVTDPRGSFVLHGLRGRPVDVLLTGLVRRAVDDETRMDPIALRASIAGVVPPAADLELVAREVVLDRKLEVLVVDPDGAPVRGAGVSYRSPAGSGSTQDTDAQGLRAFEHLEDAPLQVSARPPDSDLVLVGSEPVEVRPDGSRITLALRRGIEIQVLVLDVAGRPARGAALVLTASGGFESLVRRSDGDGRCRFLVPATGKYTLWANWRSPDGAAFSSHVGSIEGGREIVVRLTP